MATELQHLSPDTRSSHSAKRPLSVISSIADLDPLEELWSELLIEEASPFQTFAWSRSWYESFCEDYDEIIVVVSGNRKVICPFYRKGRSIRMAADQICDYQDAIARTASDVAEAWSEISRWAASRGWEIHLSRLATRGLLYEAVHASHDGSQWFPPIEKRVGPCPTFPIRSTTEATLAHLPRKLRAELRRQTRRVEKEYPGTLLEILQAPHVSCRSLGEMVSFHREQFKFDGPNPLGDERLVNMLLSVRNRPEVGLRISKLGNENTTLATDITFVRGKRFYGFLTAYNLEASQYSPGSCLLTARMEHLIESDRLHTFDFLCGGEPYKYRFATEEYYVQSVRLSPKNQRGAIRYLIAVGDLHLRRFAKWLLEKLGLRKPSLSPFETNTDSDNPS